VDIGQVASRPAFFLSSYMNEPNILPDGIIIPSSTDYLADVDRFLEDKLNQAGIDSSIVTDIAISVSELVNNAVIHGNSEEISKTVDVRISISEKELKVTVCDQGTGFDMNGIPNPVRDENLMREVGRGLFIVKNFVDEVKVKPSSTGGTCVTIVKNL
jgi:serine/threonine-protein kinase RsbW